MIDRQSIHHKMEQHYEQVWQRGDAWELESSDYEQARYDFQLGMLKRRRYSSALEVGCGSGCFTRRLAGISDRLLAIDIAETAIERARKSLGPSDSHVELRVANVMEYDLAAESAWDLIVVSETIYCLGWLYSFSEIGWFALSLHNAMKEGGHLLLANTYGHERDWLLLPGIIDTYRDLFSNVGFRSNREEIFCGTKNQTEFRVLMTLFEKRAGSADETSRVSC